jgi:hypothetical protein
MTKRVSDSIMAGLRDALAYAKGDRKRGKAHAVKAAGTDGTESLFDFLSGYAATISGTSEARSERSGQRFTDILLEKQRRRQRS